MSAIKPKNVDESADVTMQRQLPADFVRLLRDDVARSHRGEAADVTMQHALPPDLIRALKEGRHGDAEVASLVASAIAVAEPPEATLRLDVRGELGEGPVHYQSSGVFPLASSTPGAPHARLSAPPPKDALLAGGRGPRARRSFRPSLKRASEVCLIGSIGLLLATVVLLILRSLG